MKGAIASVEIFAFAPGDAADVSSPRPRRLSLVIGVPERAQSDGLWHCRVALADLHRPRTLAGRDSVEALCLAVECARGWLGALRSEGFTLFRDRAGAEPFAIP
ncbi:MAG: hypothetical protein U0900_20305 [Myxococcota bacterium]